MILDLITSILRTGGGVFLLRPTNLGMPAVTTAPIAHGSPFLSEDSASLLVQPRGASIKTTSASQPTLKKPLIRP